MKTGAGRIGPGRAVYSIAVAAACLLAIYYTRAVTLANVYATTRPEVALEFWPSNAVANARQADALFTRDPRRPPLAEIKAHALAALRRSPVLAGPSRALGLVAAASRDEAGAQRRLLYSERMSRRDVMTQLWLIENRVAANDVRGALSHYGIALRVAPETQQLLFPVLAGALDRPDLVAPIAGLVRQGDAWREAFLYHATANAQNLRNLTTLFGQLARTGAKPDRVHYLALLGRLIRGNQLDDAVRLYAQVDPLWRRDDANAQLDGGFERTGDVPSLGWALTESAASRDPRPDVPRNMALQLPIPDSGTQLVARRVLLLRPGAYRLTGLVGRLDGTGQGNIRVELSCPDQPAGDNRVAAAIPAQRAQFAGTLNVPACGGQQYFSIYIERSGEPAAGTAWVDELRLEPAAAAPSAARR
jgi:hypothetical protein